MASTVYQYDRSGHIYALTDPRWRGDDGSPLMLSPIPAAHPDQIDGTQRSLWRYQAALPVDPRFRVSLGEGYTPMPVLDWDGQHIHFKLEWFNPTGSFKDRGVSVLISHLRSLGATAVLEDSSGNGGSAVACYAATAGIDATIIAPEATSTAKILQARAYGATIRLVPGTRDEVGDAAIALADQIPYASHNWHPMFLQGIKTIGYEIWESLAFTAPDNVVVVAGAGSIVLGCDIAFGELAAAGLISTRPRLLVGQPEHWATIADAVNGVPAPTQRLPTIAEGAAISRPVRLPEAVAAIKRSEGAAVRISNNEIRTATRKLASRGLYTEPTSAVAAAALDRFITAGTITPDQTTVVVLTGTGLKSVAPLADIFS
ncbi:MAG: threonine synthase [Gordonia sp. (in: high G+C Gram-positive bacteria)]